MLCARPKAACFLFFNLVGAFLMLTLIIKVYSRIQNYKNDLQEVTNTNISSLPCSKVCGQTYSQQSSSAECCQLGNGQPNCKIKSICLQDYATAKQKQIDAQNQKLNYCFVLQIFFSALVIIFTCKICSTCRAHRRRQSQLQRTAALARIILHLNLWYNTNREAPPEIRRSLLSESYVSEDKTEICAVCLDAFEEQPVNKWTCGHVFHTKCAEEWIQYKTTCPVCRAKQ